MKKHDCILGYHTNPSLCGVAKFNAMLGEKLGIPVYPIDWIECKFPLISIKPSEFSFGDECDFYDRLNGLYDRYSLFLHSYDLAFPDGLIKKAEAVFAANSEIARRIDLIRPVVPAWAPSLLVESEPFHMSEINVFSFGMAHKIMSSYYKRLDDLLKATGKSYCLYLSAAIHEGTEFEDAFTNLVADIRKVFSGPVYFLGCLSDAAVTHYLTNADYFAAFFPSGVRENNTSVNAALELGVSVITNVDNYSPGYEKIDHNGIPVYKHDVVRSWDSLVNLIEREGVNA